MNHCRACGEAALISLALPPEKGGPWHRCLACASDSSAEAYDGGRYAADYLAAEVAATGGEAARDLAIKENMEWFARVRHLWPNNDFLDVGCLDGAGLRGMAARGAKVHGFDVNPAAGAGDHVTIAPFFSAHLFPQRYGLVLAREVIEHVDGWRQFVFELSRVTVKDGLCQVQTPLPVRPGSVTVHMPGHLQVLAPPVLWAEFRKWGFGCLGCKFWATGQNWLFRHVDDGPV